jgi:hypothetical protein
MPRINVGYTFAPYLLVKPLSEEDDPKGSVELNGDELADLEATNKRFAEWQARLAEMDPV